MIASYVSFNISHQEKKKEKAGLARALLVLYTQGKSRFSPGAASINTHKEKAGLTRALLVLLHTRKKQV